MAPSIRTIANYYTHQEYSIDFFGDELIVTVTWTPSVIRQWIHNVHFFNRFTSHPLVVGVGVYWTLPGHYVDPPLGYDPPADTLQLCVGTRCIIIQLSHCDHVPYALHNFLACYTHVGVWNSQDKKKLEQCGHQLKIGKLLDIRRFVGGTRGRSLRGCSFEVIVEECMGYRGVRLDPAVSMSDWSVYELCDDQILQASIKVYVCYKLGVRCGLWEVWENVFKGI